LLLKNKINTVKEIVLSAQQEQQEEAHRQAGEQW
jgi:hypothetical protein